MSDPVTHEIDLDEIEDRFQVKGSLDYDEASVVFNRLRAAEAESAKMRDEGCPQCLAVVQQQGDEIAGLRARAEAAEAERDEYGRMCDSYHKMSATAAELRAKMFAENEALRARVPTEDEIAALARIDAYQATTQDYAALRALVARNTPKETNPNG